MVVIPFKRFIITLLLFNKSIPYIVDKLKSFGYHVEDAAVGVIFKELKDTLPSSIKSLIESGTSLDPSDETHKQWLEHFGILDFYDYINSSGKRSDGSPLYFKWFDDCMWIHTYRDIMCLVNIFLFNGEPPDQISDVVQFKYKKKIGVDAIGRYQSIFWNTDGMTAKDAVESCIPFQDNSVIVRSIRKGSEKFLPTENEPSNDGSDIGFVFHDSEYIKWKIGYRSTRVPGTADFLDQVKRDSYFKYYESMNATQSVESEESTGFNDKIGEFSQKMTRYRNLEEQRAKLAGKWLETFLKADKGKPPENMDKDDFFERMQQVELEFSEFTDEKIVNIKDNPDVIKDIKGDMQ